MLERIQWRTKWFSRMSPLVVLMLAACLTARAQRGADVDFAQVNGALLDSADEALSQSPFSRPQIEAVSAIHIEPRSESHLAGQVNSRIKQLEPTIVPILERHGIPAGLTAVIAVESSGNPMALSPKGARGLWQLMPQTARRYGLVVDNFRDERLDIAKSTSAAAQYLNDLYAQFGSWPLALAAYNRGEQGLADAIRHAHSSDLSRLFASGALPAETRSYVPAVLARWNFSADRSAQKLIPSGAVVYAHAQNTTTQPAAASVFQAATKADLISATNAN
jgi:hypothetical protein